MRTNDIRAERENTAVRARISSQELHHTHVCTHMHRGTQARDPTVCPATRIKSRHRSLQHHPIVALAESDRECSKRAGMLNLSYAESTAISISQSLQPILLQSAKREERKVVHR